MGEIIDPSTKKPVIDDSTKEVIVPDEIAKKIKDKENKETMLINEFINVSIQRANLVIKETDILEKMKNNAEAKRNRIEEAYRKLQLDKDVDYSWNYHADGKFIGRKKHDTKSS